jgi:hypothetical protein
MAVLLQVLSTPDPGADSWTTREECGIDRLMQLSLGARAGLKTLENRRPMFASTETHQAPVTLPALLAAAGASNC